MLTSFIPATPRRRAAVVGHDSHMVMDWYQTARPALFWGSLAAALGSGVMLWLRRKHGTEALISWGALTLVSGGVAWMTRPGGPGAGAAPKAGESDSAIAATYRWLDQRASELDRAEPGWEAAALARLMG